MKVKNPRFYWLIFPFWISDNKSKRLLLCSTSSYRCIEGLLRNSSFMIVWSNFIYLFMPQWRRCYRNSFTFDVCQHVKLSQWEYVWTTKHFQTQYQFFRHSINLSWIQTDLIHSNLNLLQSHCLCIWFSVYFYSRNNWVKI